MQTKNMLKPTMPPLSFYVDPAWRRAHVPHTPLLNPWWGNPYDETSLFAKQMFDAYAPDIAYYAITDDIRRADMVLAPYRHNWLLRFDAGLLAKCLDTARTENLPLLIDGTGDIEIPIDMENVYVLRYGGYRFFPNQEGFRYRSMWTTFWNDAGVARSTSGKKGQGSLSLVLPDGRNFLSSNGCEQ